MKTILAIIVFSLTTSATAATIALDTGHNDGATGVTSPSGYREHDYNRTFVLALKAELDRRGHQVIDLKRRGLDRTLQMRASAKADLFVSIHHDSMPQAWIDAGLARQYSGFSIFVSHKNAFPGFACAKRVGAALVAIGEKPSLYHATPIPGEHRPILDDATGVHRYDDLVVLRTANNPAILLEVGVIANPYEETRLRSPKFIERAAAAVADGIDGCVAQKTGMTLTRKVY
ncbi:MAG: N-acetylmuramoyl-L-alanine amidase family protein [Burkholderiaceae bacterium]|nr:N-acetylmuramoyl-L-alanine amidase family protein [Burkholderiaceae bacterium]